MILIFFFFSAYILILIIAAIVCDLLFIYPLPKVGGIVAMSKHLQHSGENFKSPVENVFALKVYMPSSLKRQSLILK